MNNNPYLSSPIISTNKKPRYATAQFEVFLMFQRQQLAANKKQTLVKELVHKMKHDKRFI